MIYQQFQQSPLQTRISGPRAWLTMAVSISLICLSLFLLPFVLLFGAITLGCIMLFSRIYVARHLAQLNKTAAQTQARAAQAASSQYDDSMQLVRDPYAAHYQGRTFEHREDER
ncbi:hypothetical protein [Shewanella sp. HN-41]|uniref:hypothetical protein n=1 Tax=Shewanella sp. HN-41 TaxID=327275 RepID=UPI0002125E50|nr:hypothetical protein [Shewanella sp. HN-41]EGM67969.1 hypothetical protein SOHN41_03873 [Shewanella sp. HN-41]